MFTGPMLTLLGGARQKFLGMNGLSRRHRGQLSGVPRFPRNAKVRDNRPAEPGPE